MNDVWFIVAAYAVTGTALAVYTARLLLKGRQLSRQVPAGRRRWL